MAPPAAGGPPPLPSPSPALLSLPASIASLPGPLRLQLATELRHAERLRDALPPPRRRLAPPPLEARATLAYDEARFPLRATLARTLALDPPLHRLHLALPAFSASRDAHRRVMAAKAALLRPLAEEGAEGAFAAAYEALVLEVLAPHLRAALGAAEIHFAAAPTVRVQTPSAGRQLRAHCDGVYGVQEGALNFWLPLTPVRAECALHVESAPGARDYLPLLPEVGEVVRFNGRRCVHFTVPNTTNQTRVSIDFRCVIGEHFDPYNRLAREEYFSKARVTEDGSFVKVASGRISKLHGMPYS
ncbi:hypothetical protein AB1Y20_002429 [Prymnesium parvum]|uniref:Uncharacterized protein n=1 Tax=Prymnesium parvum TaxID=97485 RepID=A0AB34J7Y1_PRYPA